jgi:hypothetical protein
MELSAALTEYKVEHRLLKGPSIAHWLYGPDEHRPYTDIDVLISRHDWERALKLLRHNGFRDALETMAHPRMQSLTSHPWVLDGKGEVDLHATLKGLDADPDTVWEAFSENAEVLQLRGMEIKMLPEAGRLLHIALHAAQHTAVQTTEDLKRALERVDEARWREAVALAERVGGVAALATGLSTSPEGHALAERLGIHEVRSVDTLLRTGAVPLSEGLHELSRAKGWRAKGRLLLHELAPTPDFMRWWSPLARRGRLGLLVAYLWRPVWMLRRLPAGIRALRRAEREADPRS